ncbi:hypothetical protein [Mangrovibacillus cuniculi]|uniref:Uncharacterized protein n=1 Tax=Mangrovibacillus cuniculi TaxID=2593652 RepID=A0A7S8CCL1_9BACI|nr:hypothetical protein [Mangrovibacillus cuniculi]QPC47366.1 hypothetical protein G8O30_10605 [Mangrovibacillus cuniculi]
MIYKVVTKYNKIDVADMITGLFKFSIVPMFIINEYTFNIGIELILVLVSVFITMLIAVAEYKPEYQAVKTFFNWILVFLGVLIFIFAFKGFFSHVSDAKEVIFWKKITLEFLLISHFPLLVFLQIANYYEQILIRIKIKSKLTNKFIGKIKVLMILFKNCKFNKTKLENALSKVKKNRIVSFQQLDNMLDENNTSDLSYFQ